MKSLKKRKISVTSATAKSMRHVDAQIVRRSNLPVTQPSVPIDRAYENLSLDITIDIRDAAGRTAILYRRQIVKMLRDAPVVIRDTIWGEGKPLAGYLVEGAQRFGLTSEGSRRAVLLTRDRPGMTGERIVVKTRRFLESAFLDELEYFETSLERPTGRVSMKVLFPKTRPPNDARLVTATPDHELRRIRTRYDRDHRPYLVWREHEPQQFRTYSLRWLW